MLTEKLARTLTLGDKPIFDGKVTGLILSPSKSGCKWILRFTSPTSKKRRDAGLGTYPTVSISEARVKAMTMRGMIDNGIDPIEARNNDRQAAEHSFEALTFQKAARLVHQELSPGWKNEKHVAQWISTLETYVFPKLGNKKLEAITPADCAEALRSIWLSKVETASRTRQRMHTVMQWAWAHGYITANPLSVIDHLLPKQTNRPEHQPAMPWRSIPNFTKEHLTDIKIGDGTRGALLFAILTAARSGEVRNAEWAEIDFSLRVWTVPAARMKTGIPHRVPLAQNVIDLLVVMKSHSYIHTPLIFPSPRGKVLSDMTLTAFLRRTQAESDITGRPATAHGFRSSFRDWASENGYARDLAERALSHTVSNKVEAAYHRTDLLEQRRPMMDKWACHVMNITELQAKSNKKSMAVFFKSPKIK